MVKPRRSREIARKSTGNASRFTRPFFCLIEISNFGKENSLSSLDEQLLGFHNLASELIISKSLQENKKTGKIELDDYYKYKEIQDL